MNSEFCQETETKDFKLVESDTVSQDLKPAEVQLEVAGQSASEINCEIPSQAPAEMHEPVAYTPHAWSSHHSSGLSAAYSEPLVGPWRMFWHSRGRQIFNAIYFIVACFSLWIIAVTCSYLTGPAFAVMAFFGILAICSCVYAIFHRTPTASTHEFSPATQKNLRRFALISPAVIASFAVWNCLSMGLYTYYFFSPAHMNTLGAELPARTDKLLDMMLTASPFNTMMYKPMYETAMRGHAYEKALFMQDKLVALNPNDTRMKIERLLPMGLIPGREDEFQKTKDEYIKLYGTDGYLWSTLSQGATERGDFPLALEMATKHVSIHNTESSAYRQRGEAFSRLGNTADAETDMAYAKKLDESEPVR